LEIGDKGPKTIGINQYIWIQNKYKIGIRGSNSKIVAAAVADIVRLYNSNVIEATNLSESRVSASAINNNTLKPIFFSERTQAALDYV
jgi:hypothetical protein